MIGTSPLFSLYRNGIPEITVHGEIVVTHKQKVVFQTGDCLGEYPARSLLKPFQFLATGMADGALQPWQVTALGSYSATKEQYETLHTWFQMDRHRWFEKNQVPEMFPMDEKHRVALKAAGQGPSKWFHTCLCKHGAILEACEKNGWPLDSYRSEDHPYHAALLGYLAKVLGNRTRRCVVDGCGLPSPVFLSSELAVLFESLLASAPGTPEHRVATAMHSHPDWIGGPRRVDTRLMQSNPGVLIAKEGADGLTGLAAIAAQKVVGTVGISVKISAGYLPELAALALAPILTALGLNSSSEIPKGQTVRYHFEPFSKPGPKIYDLSPSLNEKIAVWPGDVPFLRDVSLDTNLGSHLTLSSVRTTLHVGTHTDGPNHFLGKRRGIDLAPLELYLGECQVISVIVEAGGTILPEHFTLVAMRAKRILFRTRSFPNPQMFNTDFVAISVETIDWLGEQGVCLVGIDTPSVDSFASKTLDAHKATEKWGMGILEGLVLDQVSDGFYEISAVPLKLEDADASPVRVALREIR